MSLPWSRTTRGKAVHPCWTASFRTGRTLCAALPPDGQRTHCPQVCRAQVELCDAGGDVEPCLSGHDVIDLVGGSSGADIEPPSGGARSVRCSFRGQITLRDPDQGRILCHTRVQALAPVAEIQVAAILNLKRGQIGVPEPFLRAIPSKVRFRSTCIFASRFRGSAEPARRRRRCAWMVSSRQRRSHNGKDRGLHPGVPGPSR